MPVRKKFLTSYSKLPVPSQRSGQAKGSFLKLFVMGSGMNVNTVEVLPKFTLNFLQTDVILAVNSKQGKSRLFWFGCGRKRKYCVSSICNMSL